MDTGTAAEVARGTGGWKGRMETDMPASEEIPSTIRRSSDKAQRTWSKAHDSAVDEYGEGERAHRVAFAALKHSYEKVGDHWEPKEGGRRGPSDAQAKRSGGPARKSGKTAGGVDTQATVAHLREIARELGVPGRSTMNKPELIDAVNKANKRATARAREN